MINGLINTGNSCYLNCTLQCLFNNEQFISKLYQSYQLFENQLITSFIELHKSNPHKSNSQLKNPSNFKYVCGTYNDLFRYNTQQDSYESLITIIDIIHNVYARHQDNFKEKNDFYKRAVCNASLKYMKKYMDTFGYSFIIDLFYGQFISIIKCSRCNGQSKTYDMFNSLSVDPESDLKIAFKSYFKEEELESINCEKCLMKTNCIKYTSILIYPKIFIISIKKYLSKNFIMSISDDITFVSSSLQHGSRSKSRINYKLKCLVCHEGPGDLNSGHYYCIIIKNDKWYLINDENIREINPLQESKHIYYLIYEQYSL